MQLSVIIVNYNVRVFLENCLHSVKKATERIQSEIIVVDNASDDGSVEMVKQKFPGIKLIANLKNLGFAAANNQAIVISKGEYILLLNPDTVVQEDSLKIMLSFFEQHKEVGLAGCKILNPDGTLQLACRRSFPTPWVAFTKITGLSSIFPVSKIFGRYNLTYLDPYKTYEVDAVSGSFMFVRRTTYEEVGGLDEQFFMYGEDIDLCYRIKAAGWKIYYVSSTQIIHYKGESVKRSNIDEVKIFYEAMRLFVKKHYQHNAVSVFVFRIGIKIREWVAFFAKISRPLKSVLLDFLIVNISLLLGELLWFGEIFRFPKNAYPVILSVPALTIITVMYSFGMYSRRKVSITYSINSVVIGYLILSTLTFFFNQYAFSRMVIIISGSVNLILLPGWRLIVRSILKSPGHRKRSLFGRRTLIVGVANSGQELLCKLRTRVDDGYEVVGFIDINHRSMGDKIAGVEILGSIDNIGKVIEEKKVSEVIFATDSLPFSSILSLIRQNANSSINYRLVPSNMEVIIGKSHIDMLDDIPLVDIEYNIYRPINCLMKRLFDIGVSLLMLVTVYPFLLLRNRKNKFTSPSHTGLLSVPRVLRGEFSIVGPPYRASGKKENLLPASSPYFGKPGLTGLAQINFRDGLTSDEIEKYNLYYAKNQSLFLDIEILAKTFIQIIKN